MSQASILRPATLEVFLNEHDDQCTLTPFISWYRRTSSRAPISNKNEKQYCYQNHLQSQKLLSTFQFLAQTILPKTRCIEIN